MDGDLDGPPGDVIEEADGPFKGLLQASLGVRRNYERSLALFWLCARWELPAPVGVARETSMNLKFAMAGLLIACCVTPALAEEYYVVQDSTTKKCTIVKEKPTSSTSFKVLGVTIFKTESDAQGYMKKEKVCTSDQQ